MTSIINIICCYNEIEYLPKVVSYYQNENIDIFIADNKSSDGSWEWMNDNNLPCIQFDTDGCFDLKAQQAVRKTLAEGRPEYDWIIYGDADEYIVCSKSLSDVFAFADEVKCNIIKMKSFDIYNTGEDRGGDITHTYFHYKERYTRFDGIERIYRNTKGVTYDGDFIHIPNKKTCLVRDGNILNYGCTKTKAQRLDVYERRQKSWKDGRTPRGHGVHYKINTDRDWTWNKDELSDMRNHKDYAFIQPRVVDFEDTYSIINV